MLLLWKLPALKPLRYRRFCKWIVANSETVADAMNILYQAKGEQTFNNLTWLGTPIQKNPMDVFVYQEMLHELRPDVVVECGKYKGGSAYFVASMMDLLGKGRVITIDVERYPNLPVHPRITYLLDSSTSGEPLSSAGDAGELPDRRGHRYERPPDSAEVRSRTVGSCKRIPGRKL